MGCVIDGVPPRMSITQVRWLVAAPRVVGAALTYIHHPLAMCGNLWLGRLFAGGDSVRAGPPAARPVQDHHAPQGTPTLLLLSLCTASHPWVPLRGVCGTQCCCHVHHLARCSCLLLMPAGLLLYAENCFGVAAAMLQETDTCEILSGMAPDGTTTLGTPICVLVRIAAAGRWPPPPLLLGVPNAPYLPTHPNRLTSNPRHPATGAQQGPKEPGLQRDGAGLPPLPCRRHVRLQVRHPRGEFALRNWLLVVVEQSLRLASKCTVAKPHYLKVKCLLRFPWLGGGRRPQQCARDDWTRGRRCCRQEAAAPGAYAGSTVISEGEGLAASFAVSSPRKPVGAGSLLMDAQQALCGMIARARMPMVSLVSTGGGHRGAGVRQPGAGCGGNRRGSRCHDAGAD